MESIKSKFIKTKSNKKDKNNETKIHNNMRKSISYDSIQCLPNADDVTIYFNPIQFKNNIYRENPLHNIEYIQDNIELTSKIENNEIFIDIELSNGISEHMEENTNIKQKNNTNSNKDLATGKNEENISQVGLLFRENLIKTCYICLNFRLCGCNPIMYIVFLPLNSLMFIRNNKFVILNHLISIFLHIFLMIIFEIYFYFNYVIVIEKEVFLKKISSYFYDLDKYNHNKYSPFAVTVFVNETLFHNTLDNMHKNYELSLISQKNLLSKLLYQSCKLAFFFGLVLIILWFFGLFYYKNIKWKGIIMDNIVMLGLLGCFEYIFFTTIIMNYNPITDAEIKYLIIKNVYNYVTSNNTDYNNATANIIAYYK